MDQSELLARVRSDLAVRLERAYTIQTLPDLKDCAATIETYVCSYIHETLLQSAPVLIPGSSAQETLQEIQLSGQSYEINTADEPRDRSVLRVALVPRYGGTRSKKPAFKEFKLSGYGQYRSTAISLPTELNRNQESIAALIVAIFQTAYAWLENRVENVFTHPEIALGAEAYRYIRSVITSDALTDHIWLGCGIKGHGMYLLDHSVAQSALSAIAGSAALTGDSAFELMAELLGCDIPLDELSSTTAVKARNWMRFDMSRSKYRDHLPRLSRTELVVYGEDSLTILPLHAKNHDYLVAAFPSRFESELLSPLLLNREAIVERFEGARNRFSKLLGRIQGTSRSELSELGAVAGTFTGAAAAAFLKDIQRP